MKNILLIGGAGFIGSYTAERLLTEGHTVCAVDNLSLGRDENISHLKGNPEFKFIQADFSDIMTVESIFDSHDFRAVFHLAANSNIQASENDTMIDFKNTFLTTFNTLECMKKKNVSNIVFASTSAIYGNMQDIKIKEDSGPLFPVSYYGSAKLASEAFISSYSYMNNIKASIFRFPNIVGERLTHGVIFDFINNLQSDCKTLRILGDGSQRKPYLYVEDLLDAIFLAWHKGHDNLNVYNIGLDSSTTVIQIADIVCEEMELANVKYEYTGGSIGWKGDVNRFDLDSTKIRELGWQPNYDSNTSVRLSVRGYLNLCRQ